MKYAKGFSRFLFCCSILLTLILADHFFGARTVVSEVVPHIAEDIPRSMCQWWDVCNVCEGPGSGCQDCVGDDIPDSTGDGQIGPEDETEILNFLSDNGIVAPNQVRVNSSPEHVLLDVNADGFIDHDDAAAVNAYLLLNPSGVPVVDDCGECNGNNAAKGCDGVCFSGATQDDCGVCGGPGVDGDGCCPGSPADACGACGGPGVDADGCCPGSPADTCGICGGPGVDGDGCCPGSPADVCGICGGSGVDGDGCCPGSPADVCGICGGSGVDGDGCCPGSPSDACGVCGGPGVDADGCCPGNPADACGVCGGDDSCLETCLFKFTFGGYFYYDFDDPKVSIFKWASKDRLVGLGCFSSLMEEITATYIDGYLTTLTNLGYSREKVLSYLENPLAWDDPRAVTEANAVLLSGVKPSKIHTHINTWRSYLNSLDSVINNRLKNLLDDGNLYLNSSCEPVGNLPDDAEVCQIKVKYADSPISLILDPSDSVKDYLSYVSFALDPTQQGRWYGWRASSKTPLLVYDPQKSGRVIDGGQLFGNWTFASKDIPNTKSVSSTQRESSAKLWEHGYQALALLDQNHDGKVAAEELDSLALWFDENQDGISQEGEVKRLEEVGIVELYYQPDSKDEKTGDIHASRGYARMLDGQKIVGASVDWFAESGGSKSELIMRNLARSLGTKTLISDVQAEEVTPVSREKTSVQEESIDYSPHFSGIWVWQIDEGNVDSLSYRAAGMLTIMDTPEGATGHSYIELPVEENNYNVTSVMVSRSLSGKQERAADGRTLLRFEVTDDRGAVTKSVVELSQDGKQLKGKSEAESSPGQASYAYTWTAQRFAGR